MKVRCHEPPPSWSSATWCKTLYPPLHGGYMTQQSDGAKKKDLAAFAAKSLMSNTNFGSSTWARTRDLRINSRYSGAFLVLARTFWDDVSYL